MSMAVPAVSGRWLRSSRQLLCDLIREWRADRVSSLGAEIAFFGTLSALPAMIACSAALHAFDGMAGGQLVARSEQATTDLLARILGDQAAPTVSTVKGVFRAPGTGLLSLGLLGALWSVSRGFDAVIRGLDLAYDIEEQRTWAGRRITALVLALGSVAVTLVVLSVLVLGPLLDDGTGTTHEVAVRRFSLAWGWLRIPITALVVTAWTAVVYHFGPFERTSWRWHLPGAALAAAWWLAASVAFRAYLEVGVGGNQLFGALGGGLTLMIWLYLLALGLLTGGELNAVLADRNGITPDRPAVDVGRSLARHGRSAARRLVARRRRPPRWSPRSRAPRPRHRDHHRRRERRGEPPTIRQPPGMGYISKPSVDNRSKGSS